MDTEKLTKLALECKRDNIKEYRNELVRKVNTANLNLMRTKDALERVKLIPGTDETIAQLTKEIETTEKSIQDTCDAIHIIDNWKY